MIIEGSFFLPRVLGPPNLRIPGSEREPSLYPINPSPPLRRVGVFGVGVGVGVDVGFAFDFAVCVWFSFRVSLLIFQPIRRAQTLFPILIKPVTTPRPQFRVRHQPSLHWVHVHVIQFLNSLLPAPNIKVIKPPLPKTAMHRGILPQTQLSRRRFPPRPPPQPPRHSLLQHLHHHRRIRLLRLPNQQMNVLRHHDVADDDEPIPPPHFIKNDQKRIPRPHRPQKRQTPITTESNEMQLRSPIAPLEILRHREKVNFLPPFANPAKDGAPARTKTKLRSNLLEWYHPRETAVNCGNHGHAAEKGGPPAQ